MWITRDKDDNQLWLHLYSKPVIMKYTDYEGVEHERWVTESQIEIDSKLFPNLEYKDGPIEVSLIPNVALNALYKIIDKCKNETGN